MDIRKSVHTFYSSPDVSIAHWIKHGYINSSSNQITKCLYEGYTFGLSPSAIGQYITCPGDKDWESRQARAIILVSRFLNNFQFIPPSTTPVQALRCVLQRTRLPPSHGRVSLLLRRIAIRYMDCIQGRGGLSIGRENSNGSAAVLVPPTHTTTWTDYGLATFEMSYSESMLQDFNNQYHQNRHRTDPSTTGTHTSSSSSYSTNDYSVNYGTTVVLPSHRTVLTEDSNYSSSSSLTDYSSSSSSLLLSSSSPSLSPIIHGYDLSTVDAETLYVMLYAFLILNQDLHCDAVRKKMTMEDFSFRNSTISSLAMIPATFWNQCYNEILHEALPSDPYDENPRHSGSSSFFRTISNFIAHNNPLQHIVSNSGTGITTTTSTTMEISNVSGSRWTATTTTGSGSNLSTSVSSLVANTVAVASSVVSNVYQLISSTTNKLTINNEETVSRITDETNDSHTEENEQYESQIMDREGNSTAKE